MPWLTIVKWAGVVGLGLVITWAVYAGIIRPTTKPNPSTTQNAGNITNYTYNPRLTFGCISWEVAKPMGNYTK